MHLCALYRFPLKSGSAEWLDEGRCDELGLGGDRRWMVVDAATGKFLTQRVLPRMALLDARWQADEAVLLDAPGMETLRVAVPGSDNPSRGVSIWRQSLQAPDAGDAAAAWLTRVLERPCRLVHLPTAQGIQIDQDYARPGERTGFTDGFPFLLIGQRSLDDLSARVGQLLDVRRFRPNLLIAGAAPYAEDGWRRIRIGEMEFRVVKPCSRCIIPTIDPLDGKLNPSREPLATLMKYRKGDGGVFFGQNLIAEGAGVLKVGMSVEVLE
ncbi:MOSC domain-containing protein [Stutzerimonas stutzeri]|uniref:MOSC domain-containing protein n=1 Tax=Stutzerimonas stutzeri TaxID=316 RepID=A0A6I6LME6_STUST|nr:MOSC N-terminal beta barrel domain-containing protein [Stutzerimonas stutzeri]QGZ31668.1 MOSC domain-containing protein [Stutzerimonas stutzeri]